MSRANDEVPIHSRRRQGAVGKFRGFHVTGCVWIAGRRGRPLRGFRCGLLSQQTGEETESGYQS